MLSQCYRSNTEFSHNHTGPTFYKCRGCNQIICHECIGRNLPSGGLLCVECAAPVAVLPPSQSDRPVPLIMRLKRYEKPIAVTTQRVIYISSNVTSTVFTQTANFLLIILSGLGAPFRNNQPQQRTYRAGIDVSFTNYSDKVRFTLLLVAIVTGVAIAALIFAEAAGISRFRILLTLTATGVCWGITTVYLQYFFDGALGRPVSQILSYIIALLVALMFGFWLLEQQWLEYLFGFCPPKAPFEEVH